MVRPRDRDMASQLTEGLQRFGHRVRNVPGISNRYSCDVLVAQMVESIRRIQYVSVLQMADISNRRTNPDDELFDPLRAAIVFNRQSAIDEAFWMVFLFIHFGKHRWGGWRYAREVYGALGAGFRWDWATTSAAPSKFRAWLDAHRETLGRRGTPGGFGNHRKYLSLDAYSAAGTGSAFETYVEWIAPPRTHEQLFAQAYREAAGEPRTAFHGLYNSMASVASFGRTARFDYLTMIGKLNLASVEPGLTYLTNSTGPISGARLLFGVQGPAATLDQWLVELGQHLSVPLQVLEDALCNWQKSPSLFKAFRL